MSHRRATSTYYDADPVVSTIDLCLPIFCSASTQYDADSVSVPIELLSTYYNQPQPIVMLAQCIPLKVLHPTYFNVPVVVLCVDFIHKKRDSSTAMIVMGQQYFLINQCVCDGACVFGVCVCLMVRV